MNKTLLTTFVLASLSASTAMAAVQTFTWNGGVPVFAEDAGYKIVKVGLTDFDAGLLDFKNDGTTITLDRSDSIQFKVMKEGATAGAPMTQVAYTMSLTAMRVNGVEDATNPNFDVSNGASPLALNADVSVNDTAISSLSITQKGAQLTDLVAGDRVAIAATMTINPVI